MPFCDLRSDINSADKDNEDFILKVINSLKSEYLEKQKQAFNELIKRLAVSLFISVDNHIDKTRFTYKEQITQTASSA
jgi:hypothetical protein